MGTTPLTQHNFFILPLSFFYFQFSIHKLAVRPIAIVHRAGVSLANSNLLRCALSYMNQGVLLGGNIFLDEVNNDWRTQESRGNITFSAHDILGLSILVSLLVAVGLFLFCLFESY